ncbi:MAG: nucleotidyltransferase [Clostridia bacterium]|nr:nucleotidyltransferase [Clostridia bacterium]
MAASREPILLIMAAGMGSRYGGLKQLDQLGPGGEVILHYSVYDAMRAGFRRVVFLIKHEIETEFREKVGACVERHMEVSYAFQELSRLPDGFSVPEGRTKPWGTAHAVLCCRDQIDAPFCVINADDYYGPSAFRSAYEFLKNAQDDEKKRYMMVGYLLSNTTTPNGHVARGVCEVSEDGYLQSVREHTHIVESSDGPLTTEDGAHYTLLSRSQLVSMNMWGFTPSLMDALESGFPPFLQETIRTNPEKGEYFLPSVVSGMLDQSEATVQVLESRDKWYGVTYHEDRATVQGAIARMTEEGTYPSPLFP